MARRRVVYPVDTSDWLANIVLASLVVAVVALLGLLILLDNDDGAGLTAQETGTAVPGATTVVPSPSTAPTDDAEEPPVAVEPPTGAAGGAVDDEPEGTGTTPTPEPLQPRGIRTEPGQTTAPDAVPPPAGAPEERVPEDTAPDDTTPDDTTPEERVPEDTTPDDTTPDDGVSPEPDEPDEPDDSDEPVVPASPLDDPDRVPRLVVVSSPTDIHTVIVDLDDDGVEERVWAALVSNSVHVRVQRDDDGRWADPTDAASAVGAIADDLVELSVEDVTGDGRLDIHTKQWVGVNGESVSLWSFTNGRLRPMTASGGCWDGEDTFGVVGARVDPGQVLAICEEDPLPPYLWSTAVYRWVDDMWTFQQRVGAYG